MESVRRLRPCLAMFFGNADRVRPGAVAIVSWASNARGIASITVTQNVYEEMASITLLSIPLFILKGAAYLQNPVPVMIFFGTARWLASRTPRARRANVSACSFVSRRWPIVARHLLGHRSAGIRKCASVVISCGSRLALSPPAEALGILRRLRSQ